MSTLSENIKNYRKLNKLTQKDLANRLGIAPTSVSAWELGRNKPLMDNIEQMATIFQIKKSELLGDTLAKLSISSTLRAITETAEKLDDTRQTDLLSYAKNLLEQQEDEGEVVEIYREG